METVVAVLHNSNGDTIFSLITKLIFTFTMPVVAMDCEMVGSGNRNLLARVSIVDQNLKVLLDEYVKPTAQVTDYRTNVSGIRRENLANGISFTEAQSKVSNLLRGNILVVHTLNSDLDVLKLSHPKEKTFDLAKHGPLMKNGQPRSLKDLAREYLHKIIQEGEHDSVVDAKAAMEIYNRLN